MDFPSSANTASFTCLMPFSDSGVRSIVSVACLMTDKLFLTSALPKERKLTSSDVKHLSACESLQLKCFGPVTIGASTLRFTSLVPVFWNLPILVELPLINHWWYLIFLYYMSQFLCFSSNTAITGFHLLHIGLQFCQVTYKSISYGKMGQQVLASTLKESPHSSPGNLLLAWQESGRCSAGLFPNFHSAVR